jgi:hypothetical protein
MKFDLMIISQNKWYSESGLMQSCLILSSAHCDHIAYHLLNIKVVTIKHPVKVIKLTKIDQVNEVISYHLVITFQIDYIKY